MKTHITYNSELIITPESDLEAYALKKWIEDWEKKEAIFKIDVDEHKLIGKEATNEITNS